MRIDVGISNDDKPVVLARVDSLGIELRKFIPYFNCHTKEKQLMTQLEVLKPVLSSIVNELFEKGIDVRRVVP
jgi:hypothetical protein